MLPSAERQKGTDNNLGQKNLIRRQNIRETVAKALGEVGNCTGIPEQHFLRNIPPSAEKNLGTTPY